MQRILITGATGQIGSELTRSLRAKYGGDNVIAAGHRRDLSQDAIESGPHMRLDVRDRAVLRDTVVKYKVATIYHLASLLSATAED